MVMPDAPRRRETGMNSQPATSKFHAARPRDNRMGPARLMADETCPLGDIFLSTPLWSKNSYRNLPRRKTMLSRSSLLVAQLLTSPPHPSDM